MQGPERGGRPGTPALTDARRAAKMGAKGGMAVTLFLTGERGVGKSTALASALELARSRCGLRCGGVVTTFGPWRGEEVRRLFLQPWGEEPDYSPERVCALVGGGRRRADPRVFDTLGVRFLRQAAEDPGVELIVLDELGFLEREADAFRAAVLEVLRGPKSVLGVVRQGLGVWQDAPLGRVLTVTEENRAALPEEIAGLLQLPPLRGNPG